MESAFYVSGEPVSSRYDVLVVPAVRAEKGETTVQICIHQRAIGTGGRKKNDLYRVRIYLSLTANNSRTSGTKRGDRGCW